MLGARVHSNRVRPAIILILVMLFPLARTAFSEDSEGYYAGYWLKGCALRAAPSNKKDTGWVEILRTVGPPAEHRVLDSVWLVHESYCVGDTNGFAFIGRSSGVMYLVFAHIGDSVTYDTVYTIAEGSPQDNLSGHVLLCASFRESVIVLASNVPHRPAGTQIIRLAPGNSWKLELDCGDFACPSITSDFLQLLLVDQASSSVIDTTLGTLYTYDLDTKKRTDVPSAGHQLNGAFRLNRSTPIVYSRFLGQDVNLWWTDGKTARQLTSYSFPRIGGLVNIDLTERVLTCAAWNVVKRAKPIVRRIPFSEIGW